VTLRGQISQGTLRVAGYDVGAEQHLGKIGLAPLDPPLPPRMTVRELLAISFRAAGCSGRRSRDLAAVALQEAGLPSLATRHTESLALPERRAVAIAQALLPDASCVFLESPLDGLEGRAADYVLQILGHVSDKRRVVATATRLDARSSQRDLLMGAQHIVIADSNHVVWSGKPEGLVGAAHLVAVTLAGDTTRFIERLLAHGFNVQGAPPHIAIMAPAAPFPDLVHLAAESGAIILEMDPWVPSLQAQDAGTGSAATPGPLQPLSGAQVP
jgi:ABC-2 type transport system ATP-binding protein